MAWCHDRLNFKAGGSETRAKVKSKREAGESGGGRSRGNDEDGQLIVAE